MNAALRMGCGVYGTPLMKFNLTYDGELPPSANKGKSQAKWRIRKYFDPQLRILWKTHPGLRALELDGRHFPIGGGRLHQLHHFYKSDEASTPADPESTLDLCAPIEKHGAWFRPLVRETFALHCGLKILFLRPEPAGRVYQGGDIDGRIKTLLDALAMPQHVEQVLETIGTPEDPLYCLLQEDSMVSGLNVETDRLLTDDTCSADYARLTIEVDVRVRQAMIYNQSFFG